MGYYVPKKKKPVCINCPFRTSNYCGLLIDYDDIREFRFIPNPHCPLIEVNEPHGRLIDANTLCERLLTAWHTADENGKRIISEVMADIVTPIVVNTSTVIDAEGQ